LLKAAISGWEHAGRDRQSLLGGAALGEATSSAEAPAAEIVSSPASGGAAAPDIEEVVDQVMRRLTRTLAVESERHGGRRWP